MTQAPPLVAILRGVTSDRILPIADRLIAAGLTAIEIPLNSPDPFRSLEKLVKAYGDGCLCGAGTVLSADDVDRVRDHGGRLIVTPNSDPAVIARAVTLGLLAMPGFATATEAFAAIHAGARALKLFPAASYGPAHLKALKAVLPKDVSVHAVGGIGPEQMAVWRAAGADGFGLGSELFRPDYENDEIAERARLLVAAWSA